MFQCLQAWNEVDIQNAGGGRPGHRKIESSHRSQTPKYN